jgi:transposase InsO family protein
MTAATHFTNRERLANLNARTVTSEVVAQAAIVEHIELVYNSKRHHSSLGYVSPAEHEQSE